MQLLYKLLQDVSVNSAFMSSPISIQHYSTNSINQTGFEGRERSTAFTVFDHDETFMDWITSTANLAPVEYGNYGFSEKTDYQDVSDEIERL